MSSLEANEENYLLDTNENSSSVMLVKKRRKKLSGNSAIVANQAKITNQTALAMDEKAYEIQHLRFYDKLNVLFYRSIQTMIFFKYGFYTLPSKFQFK